MIPNYAKGNFIINENDTPAQVLAKQFHLNKDMIDRQFQAEQQLAEINKRLQDFTEKYIEIKKMKGKNTIEQLELQLAIEELIDENK